MRRLCDKMVGGIKNEGEMQLIFIYAVKGWRTAVANGLTS